MFKKFSIISLLTILFMALPGCNDDFYEVDPNEIQFEEGLTICVPRQSATRATTTGIGPTEGERTINSLTLFLYRYEGSDLKEVIVKQLKGTNSNDTKMNIKGSYETYNISKLKKGTYKVYVVANAFNSPEDKETTLASHFNKETTLETNVFNFSEGYFAGTTDSGIPMTCHHRDIRKSTSETDFLSTDMLDFQGTTQLYVDLTFAMAKVTVNVEGPAGGDIDINSVGLSGHPNKMAYFSGVDFTQANTPAAGTDYSVTRANCVSSPLYVPENEKCSSFQPELEVKYGAEGDDFYANGVKFKLGEEGSDEKYSLKRGHWYQYTVTRDGRITLDVVEWEGTPLDVEINAPFELVILEDEPKISTLASGEEQAIRFRTDADPSRVSIVSPDITYKDKTGAEKTVKFFKWRVVPSQETPNTYTGYVQINTEVPYDVLDAVIKGRTVDNISYAKTNHDYFHIKANNLMKRINIGSFTATAVFDVTPKEVTINVNEYFASAMDYGEIRITFNTNAGGVSRLSGAKWEYDDNTPDENFNANDSHFTLTSKADGEAQNGTDVITLSGLMQGDDFWQKKKTLVLKYKVDDTTGQLTEAQKTKTVKIRIRPFTDRYVIHFKSLNGRDWQKPHIYVYQCLELPSDITNSDGSLHKNAGKTVGIAGDPNAALQYCFTGDFTFKGWKNYGGPIEFQTTNSSGNYYIGGNLDGGFVKMEGVKLVNTNTSNPYAAGYKEDDGKAYKFMKFNEHHFLALKANYDDKGNDRPCKEGKCNEVTFSDAYFHSWPGLVMYYETKGDAAGWWTYELSGAAEPGKTLIMFTNGHDYDHMDGRFPGDNLVGIPLFDYEDKEGWFVLANYDTEDYVYNKFYDDKPSDSDFLEPNGDMKLQSGKQRVYYYNSERWNKGYGCNAQFEKGSEKVGKEVYFSKDNGWFYAEIDKKNYYDKVYFHWDNWAGKVEVDISSKMNNDKIYYKDGKLYDSKP